MEVCVAVRTTNPSGVNSDILSFNLPLGCMSPGFNSNEYTFRFSILSSVFILYNKQLIFFPNLVYIVYFL